MIVPILATKLFIPPVSPSVVPRPRLVERLNQGLSRKLTLISAPAGFGKTILVSVWAGCCGRNAPEGPGELSVGLGVAWMGYALLTERREKSAEALLDQQTANPEATNYA